MAQVKGAGFSNATALALPRGKKIALGIGINAYQSKYWRPLNNAVRDVQTVISLLMNKYDFDDYSLLLDKDATGANIEETLYRFTDSSVLGENDSLLIYYSGHGHLDKNKLGYWVPVDAEKDRIHTYLPNGRLRELISNFKCRHLLLISDACFSGSLFAQFKGHVLHEEVAEEYESRSSRYAFCSGRHDELVSDGDDGGNSPFAKAIIQELSLNEKKINIVRLADQVIDLTRINYKQMPIANPIVEAGHMGGQFVFTPRDYHADHEKLNHLSPVESYRIPELPKQKRIQFPWIFAGLAGLLVLVVLLKLWGVFSPQIRTTKVVAMPNEINLGKVWQGETKTISFSLTNLGKINTNLDQLNFDNQEFQEYKKPIPILDPGQVRNFAIKWIAKDTGVQEYKIWINGQNLDKMVTVVVRANVLVKPGEEPVKEIKNVESSKKKTQVTKPKVNLELLE